MSTKSQVADYILKGNAIFTAKTDSLIEGFVAVKGNKILKVGSEKEFNDYMGSDTKVYDFKDKLIMPGFHDSHFHVFLGALMLNTVNLEDTTSEEQAAKKVYETFKGRDDDWVFGFGWTHFNWDIKELPTKASLDKYFPDRPVCIFNEELHGIWANSKALEICNITSETPSPYGGEILKDTDGEPTGYLLETATELLTPIALDMDSNKVLDILKHFLEATAKYGITSVSDLQIFNFIDYQSLKRLEDKNKLTTRVHFAVPLATNINKLKTLQSEYSSDKLRFSGTKEFIDGTAPGYTALMLEPYCDKDHKGIPRMEEELLRKLVLEVDKAGFRIRLHACGDGAVRLGLDLYEEAQKVNGKRDSRHTLEHFETIHPDDLPRLKELGVIASIQPDHLVSPTYEGHPFHEIIGEERNQYGWAYKSMLNYGATLASGTDFPITGLDPMVTVYRAVTRLHEDKKPKGGWIPKEKLTIAEVLKSYTIGSAYQDCRDHDLGTLEEGKLADIVILDKNLFNIDEEEIRNTNVIMTMMDGEIIYNESKLKV